MQWNTSRHRTLLPSELARRCLRRNVPREQCPCMVAVKAGFAFCCGTRRGHGKNPSSRGRTRAERGVVVAGHATLLPSSNWSMTKCAASPLFRAGKGNSRCVRTRDGDSCPGFQCADFPVFQQKQRGKVTTQVRGILCVNDEAWMIFQTLKI